MTTIIAETRSTTLVSVYLAAMGLVTVACAWGLTNTAAVRDDLEAIPGSRLKGQEATS
ncbi:hypothetical protein ACQEU6_01930 [Spirillospora sp. CA-108201]